ncbi:GNAT family N-acetyltransferase [Candidatus Nitrosarchaeum limnium]|jgi:ribosomal protein S18 acetylase RimI-like enzyme|uniref:Acetyltransferase, GNAT family n=1 Tax=Candidatus Nitrosarchaeum limnium BG20 TaxID=859192 RepID=S2ELZ5_9ARCH|nr:GNAT family N-acetyltransferase [Candidatus Nitrosarchaeum limnium]EPA05547.1 acetyltransferase, GNAT family [Candidatus Nitrosarchaeum limnium BG20]
MEVSVRRAQDKDVKDILEILYELERPKPIDSNELKIFKNKIDDYLADPQKEILVAKENSKIIGVASIVFIRRLNRAKLEMYIPELVVSKEFRNQGIGEKLIQHCTELSKKKKCYRIRLESGNQRKDSHKFYKKMGFEQSALSFTKNIL